MAETAYTAAEQSSPQRAADIPHNVVWPQCIELKLEDTGYRSIKDDLPMNKFLDILETCPNLEHLAVVHHCALPHAQSVPCKLPVQQFDTVPGSPVRLRGTPSVVDDLHPSDTHHFRVAGRVTSCRGAVA